MDPYKVLGLKSNASEDEVRKAYKKLSMKHHPDRGGDEAKFKEINEAYSMIKDGKKPESGPGFGTGPDINWRDFDFDLRDKDAFAEFLRQAKARQRQRQHYKFTVPIQLKDAVVGGKHYIRIPVGNNIETVEVTIPAGTQDGDAVKYPRLAGGVDIVIKFEVLPDKEWVQEGLDLIKEIKVSVWDLIQGTEVNVQTIYDTTIKLKVPPMTQPNTTMRIKGKGIQSRQQLNKIGDMYVHIAAYIPKDIDEEILSAIRRANS